MMVIAEATHPFYVFLGKLFQGIIEHLTPLAFVFLFGDVVLGLHLSGALAIVTARSLCLELL